MHLRSRKLDLAQHSSSELCVTDIRFTEVSTREICVGEVRALQHCASQIHTSYQRSTERRLLQTCARHVQPTQVRTGKCQPPSICGIRHLHVLQQCLL